MRKLRGFTLIELLAVITIIAILSTIGFSVFSGAQKNSRDQQRFRDLNAVSQALELYRNDNQSYPASLSDLLPTYLDSLPSDPTAGRSYQYLASPTLPIQCQTAGKTCTTYCLFARREGNNNIAPLPTACKGTTLQCSRIPGDCNMGVSSP